MRKRERLWLACFGAAVLSMTIDVQAADRMLFSCATKNGKRIELTDAGKTIDYSFGKVGKPDLALRVPRASATTYQWKGIGRYVNYEVNVPNGDTVYSVYSSLDKIEQTWTGGVRVTVKGREVADVKCLESAKNIDQLYEAADLRPRDE